MIPRIGSFVTSPFKGLPHDPWRGLPELGSSFDPSLQRTGGLSQSWLQVPLLNPNGASFRVWPDEGGAIILMIDAQGHPLHGNRMRIPRNTAIALASQIIAVVRGESGGNAGTAMDANGNVSNLSHFGR